MHEKHGLHELTGPIRQIKTLILDYLCADHPNVIRTSCLCEFPVDELISEQVEEEVNSLLKVTHRFKESLAVTYSELQYGEPVMEGDTNDHAPKLKEDSKHWEGIEGELNNDKA